MQDFSSLHILQQSMAVVVLNFWPSVKSFIPASKSTPTSKQGVDGNGNSLGFGIISTLPGCMPAMAMPANPIRQKIILFILRSCDDCPRNLRTDTAGLVEFPM